jgi:hypothetical protein
MNFKFAVGADVGFNPPGKKPSKFKVLRHMPVEQQGSSTRKYRIKSLGEGFERAVSETELSAFEPGIFST